jgi:hypothetical protein
MHSCASAQRLLHRFTLLDTSLDVLEAGAKLGYCATRITHQKPHMMAIFTQLSGNRSPNGACGSNDQDGLLTHCSPPLLFLFSLQ